MDAGGDIVPGPELAKNDEADSGPPAVKGYESYLSTWANADTDVLAIKDPTHPGIDVPECVAENPDDLQECSGSPEDWQIQPDPLIEAVKNVDRETKVGS